MSGLKNIAIVIALLLITILDIAINGLIITAITGVSFWLGVVIFVVIIFTLEALYILYEYNKYHKDK